MNNPRRRPGNFLAVPFHNDRGVGTHLWYGAQVLLERTWIPAKRLAGMTIFILLMCRTGFSQVSLGIDELEKSNFKELQGRRVALITNQTGIDRDGDSTVDLLLHAPKVTLVCILTPEHGFRGVDEHGKAISDSIDPVTHLPVYSLYGDTTRPTEKMLKGVNTVVFDIQDVGTRFYTYVTTMAMAMEEAAKRKLRFVVLDRPNPVRGDIVDGDILDRDIKRMTGYYPIPVRHGLTIGELAKWFNETEKIKSDLVVIPMKQWPRDQWFDQTGLLFVNPSPNIRSTTEAVLYSGIGCFEASNIAVGRGTDTPFEIFGAPWIKGKALTTMLREKNFPGALFEPVTFTPEKDIYAGEKCEGTRIIVTDRERIRPYRIFVAAFLYLHEMFPKDFKPDWEEVRVVTGSNKLKDVAENRLSVDEYFRSIDDAIRLFREQISAFYLY